MRRALSTALVTAGLVVSAVPVRGQAGSIGQWSAVFTMPLVAVHAALMHTGQLLFFDAWEIPGTPSARLWDPDTDTYTPVPNGFAELFCAGHILTHDGRLITTGGHNGSGVGTRDATVFDPTTEQWTPLPDLNWARWYPTLVQLSDGRGLTLGGAISRPAIAEIPEAITLSGGGWTPFPAAQKDVGEYPQVYEMPNGSVFVAAMDDSYTSWRLDLDTSLWTSLGRPGASSGTSVMYRPGKVMMTGGGTMGGDPVLRATAVIDLNAATPSWRETAPMAFGRSKHTLVVLPDGKVLVVGGAAEVSLVSTNGVLPAELWDPVSETWTQMAAMVRNRMYHSTAVLLPDGRVLAAGGGRINPAVTDETNGQFYSPPYLFRGARPQVTAAPASVIYDATFTVDTPDPSAIMRVTLIRASSVTHGINMDQRFFELPFTANGNSLSVHAPANPHTAPAGDYLLFALDANDVPSVGRFVRLGGPPAAASLSISDASANEGTAAGGSLVFTVTLAGSPSQTVTATYASLNGTATAGSDYTSVSGTLSFPPGTASKTIVVPVTADANVEPNETLDVVLSAPSNATIADGVGRGTIVNDDVAVTPTISINSVSVAEGTGTGTPVASFTVTLSAASALNVLVDYRTVPGTAVSPADFGSTHGTLTFAGGTTVQTIQVPIVADALVEGNETFAVELFNPVHADIATLSGTATIDDDDGVPVTATFVVGAAADDVNESGTTFTPDGGTVWLGNGSDTAASYVGLRFNTVAIPAGATVTAAHLEVTALTTQWTPMAFSAAAEAASDSLPFSASSPPSVRPLLPPTVAHASDVQWVAGTRYPLDDIRTLIQAVVQQPQWAPGHALSLVLHGVGTAFNRKYVASAENGAATAPRLVVTFVTEGPPGNQPPAITAATGTPTSGVAPLVVQFSGAATDPEQSPLAYTWTFGDGQTGTGGAATHTYSAPGSYMARLAVSDGAVTINSAPIAIVVGVAPLPTLSIGDATVTEGDSGTTMATFTVTRSAPGGTSSVSYATVNGTAAAPGDFAETHGTLTFTGAEVTRTIAVPIVGDTDIEPTETFSVVLSAPVGALLADDTGAGSIINDDAIDVHAPRTLTGSVAGDTVSFSWVPPTAAPPSGYVLEAGFSPGQTAVTLELGAATAFATRAPDGTYYVRLRARFGGAPGPASNEVRVGVGQAEAPLPPRSLLATVQDSYVTFAWSQGPEGPTVAGFQLRAGRAPGVADRGVVPLPASARSFSVTAPPGSYYVWVVAVNAAGPSSASNVAVVSPTPGICTVPSPPSSLRALATSGGIRLEWSAPSAGAIPASYYVAAGSAPGGSDRGAVSLPGSQHDLAAPVPPGTYFVRVVAANACGTSAPSNEAVATVP